MENKLIVSSSPHLSGTVKTRNIMLDVIIALIPALIASVVYFGIDRGVRHGGVMCDRRIHMPKSHETAGDHW